MRYRVEVIRRHRARVTISHLLLIVDVAVLVMAVGHLHGAVRLVAGLIFGVVTPGWSIVGLLKLGNAALEFSLTIAVSLALLMVLAQVLMTIHYWNLVVLQEVLCLLCLPSLIWQSSDHVRVRRSVE